jgi:2-oxo-3-(phosphooxy)propyl 3-oxoalkanoate synthase
MTAVLETPDAARLSFDATLPRRLVHRAAISEVFVTDSAQIGDRILVGSQLPRAHALFNDGPDSHYDLLLVLETLRQSGILTAHRYRDVPSGDSFVFQSFDLRVEDLAAARMAARPAQVVVELGSAEEDERPGVMRSLLSRSSVAIDGRPYATGSGLMLFLPRPAYDELRSYGRRQRLRSAPPAEVSTAATEPMNPARVGRRNPRNVVVGAPRPAGAAAWRTTLVVDRSHPSFFDHELDHVPAMLLLEAFRQTALAAVAERHGLDPWAARLTRCAAEFTGFAELELPTACTAAVGDPLRGSVGGSGDGPVVAVQVGLEQAGASLSTGVVELTYPAAGGS